MLVGKEFGPYVIDKELGSGAMGTVVRASHAKKGNYVAIKLMSLALGSSENALKRFKREVEILRQLDHPNIVKYLGSGKYHGAPFYIMEYVDGESLDHVFHRRGRLPWEEVIDLGIHVCAALQHAHEQGIIHRDLKPSNLMILKDGTVKLTDFGIAKDTDVTALTNANSTVGTAAYMSPEQCRGTRDITAKTDLYSMGIMFYELLTGRKPFIGETAMEVFLQHANNTDYKTPAQFAMEVPIWLDTLVCQLMEKEPSKRPLNASTVAESLKLIKEKIEVQRSAGIDAASKRRIDRTSRDKALDEDDKSAARAMLGKKPKKEKSQPFYARGWFTILALLLIAVGSSVGVYYVFLRTPSAEALLSEVETLMKTDRPAARTGPIALFLSAYPQHEKVGQVQQWADQIDFEQIEKQFHNRRERNFKLEGKDRAEEQLARDALDDENAGNLSEAAGRWEELSKRKASGEFDIRVWGLLGERYGQNLRVVESLYQQLSPQKAPGDELERLALAARAEEVRHAEERGKAARAVKAGDAQAEKAAEESAKAHLAKARDNWDQLLQRSKRESARNWHLMSAWRLRELKGLK